MKKAAVLSVVLILVLPLATLCLAEKMQDDKGSMMQNDKGSMMAGPMMSGAELWKSITGNMSYTNWHLFPGTTKMQKGGEPHGALVSIYVNGIGEDAVKMMKSDFADGSVIVKENFTPDKTLAAITVMQKSTGFNPDGGDWFWAKYKPDGTIDAEGKVQGCINCHSKAADHDWVFTGKSMGKSM